MNILGLNKKKNEIAGQGEVAGVELFLSKMEDRDRKRDEQVDLLLQENREMRKAITQLVGIMASNKDEKTTEQPLLAVEQEYLNIDQAQLEFYRNQDQRELRRNIDFDVSFLGEKIYGGDYEKRVHNGVLYRMLYKELAFKTGFNVYKLKSEKLKPYENWIDLIVRKGKLPEFKCI
ncbi:hypothetical protein ACFOUV_02570 [Oceanobacillus longus]|uniref:Uncharacterized protein n=1 Tax=Oceanobacillus longus TaxID=930120 RepID=A0ABV8GS32_9BACI